MRAHLQCANDIVVHLKTLLWVNYYMNYYLLSGVIALLVGFATIVFYPMNDGMRYGLITVSFVIGLASFVQATKTVSNPALRPIEIEHNSTSPILKNRPVDAIVDEVISNRNILSNRNSQSLK